MACLVTWQVSSVSARAATTGNSAGTKTVPYKIKYTKETINGPLYDVDIATSVPTGTPTTLENQDVPNSHVVKSYHGGSVLSSSFSNGKYYTVIEVYVTYGAP